MRQRGMFGAADSFAMLGTDIGDRINRQWIEKGATIQFDLKLTW